MDKLLFCLMVLLFTAFGSYEVTARTDDLDLQVLQSMYIALNRPLQLKGWMAEGGDPCGHSWRGVSCFGSSVNFIQLPGLGLSGNLGVDLVNLRNLKQLDLSSNEIHGEIPLRLPINITHLNLASNNFSQNIPYSLSYMKSIHYLNLSNNQLSGVLGDFYGGLHYLREMDLSFNHFIGDLPTSFGSLKNLSKLYLQGNAFTGSVVHLAKLQLSELNIQDNNFSGFIPEEFQNINNLWLRGNSFHNGDNYLPWKYTFGTLPDKWNITIPPTAATSTIETSRTKKRRKMGSGTITILAISGSLLAAFSAFAALAAMYLISRIQGSRSVERGQSSMISSSGNRSWHLPPVRVKAFKVSGRSLSKKSKIPISAKLYSISELQLATSSFSKDNFLGEGSVGSVYGENFPDGP